MTTTNRVSIDIIVNGEDQILAINNITKLNSVSTKEYWSYDVFNQDSFPDIIVFIYNRIGLHLEDIYKLGISNEDVHIYWEIMHDGQCNFEIQKDILKLISLMNIDLAITCFNGTD